MGNIREIDELNIISMDKGRSLPYGEYFGEMELEVNEKANRIELARQLESVYLLFFTLAKREAISHVQNVTLLKERYKEVVSGFGNVDLVLSRYINNISESIARTTVKNIKKEYYTSYDRAMYIAENEANTNANYLQYIKAIKSGKKKKQWIDMKDSRERKTHLEVGGIILPIKEIFEVGDSRMLFPKDISFEADAEEICGCRCTIRYF